MPSEINTFVVSDKLVRRSRRTCQTYTMHLIGTVVKKRDKVKERGREKEKEKVKREREKEAKEKESERNIKDQESKKGKE